MNKLYIILVVFLLIGCSIKPNQGVKPNHDPEDEVSEETTYRNPDKQIIFDDSIETTKVIEYISIEILFNRTGDNTIFLDNYINPSFYFVTYDSSLLKDASIEGTAVYNSELNELNLNYTIGVGTSTGVLDGDHVDYVLHLDDETISNFNVAEWTGKDDDDLVAKDLSEQDYIDFGFSIYSTIKEKYKDWKITEETF